MRSTLSLGLKDTVIRSVPFLCPSVDWSVGRLVGQYDIMNELSKGKIRLKVVGIQSY